MSQYLSEIEHFAVFSHRFGGDDGIRTHDPLLAGQVLSQLSYTPVFPKVLTPSLKDPSKLNNKPYKDFHPSDYIRSPNIADSP